MGLGLQRPGHYGRIAAFDDSRRRVK